MEVVFIHLVDLGGYLEGDAAGPRDLDGKIGPFFRTDSTEKRQIAPARIERWSI